MININAFALINYGQYMETINNRIKLIVDELFDGNVSAFCRRVGVKQPTINTILGTRQSKPSYDIINAIALSGLGVSLAWLVTGSGEMKDEGNVKDEVLEIPLDLNKGDFLIENNNGVKFYDLGNGRYRMTVSKVPFCAYGRFANESDRLDPDKEDWETESFEWDRIVHGRYLAFEVKGDSMDNGTRESFEEGDVVLVRELDRSHWRDGLRYKDHPYWVVVFGTSVLIKQMTGCDMDEGKITLHSLNPSPEFSDFSLPLDSVRALYYVLQKKPKVVRF